MNASNHLRRAVSSLTRETKGIVMAITAKDKLQFLFRVLGGCSSQVQPLSRTEWFTKQLTRWLAPIFSASGTADSITLHHPTTDYGMKHVLPLLDNFTRPLIPFRFHLLFCTFPTRRIMWTKCRTN